MTRDLIVPDSETVTLDETVNSSLLQSRRPLRLETFDELVQHGILASEEELKVLLKATSEATRTAIHDINVYRAREFVPGTFRPDFGRFPSVLAATPNVNSVKTKEFWNIVRGLDPEVLTQKPSELVKVKIRFDLVDWLFRDVTVKTGSTLRISDKNPRLSCNDLLLERGARIVVTGRSLHINAKSIKGE